MVRTSPPTTHLEMYGGVLFAMVIMVEQHDGRHRLCNSADDDDDDDDGMSM